MPCVHWPPPSHAAKLSINVHLTALGTLYRGTGDTKSSAGVGGHFSSLYHASIQLDRWSRPSQHQRVLSGERRCSVVHPTMWGPLTTSPLSSYFGRRLRIHRFRICLTTFLASGTDQVPIVVRGVFISSKLFFPEPHITRPISTSYSGYSPLSSPCSKTVDSSCFSPFSIYVRCSANC